MNGKKMKGLKQMWIKRPYFEQIRSGQKTLEARIGYPQMRRIRKGDAVLLRTGGKAENATMIKIVDVREYRDFQEALKHEDISRLLPDIRPENALEAYERIYPEWKVKQYGGVLVFELEIQEK
jgi:ASC-1-like (ASCH) protein